MFFNLGIYKKVDLVLKLEVLLEKKPLLKVSDLTKESRQSIQHKHRLDPLPAGWYYNGTQYVCMDGERSSTHP